MKDTVVFDLDGTLANIEHRLHLVKCDKPDFDEFYARVSADKPNEWCVELMLQFYRAGYEVIIVSARRKNTNTATRKWLEKYRVPHTSLKLLREDGDSTPDQQLKRDWVRSYGADRILFVVDDRQKVVDMWRAEGVTCLQCAKWEEHKKGKSQARELAEKQENCAALSEQMHSDLQGLLNRAEKAEAELAAEKSHSENIEKELSGLKQALECSESQVKAFVDTTHDAQSRAESLERELGEYKDPRILNLIGTVSLSTCKNCRREWPHPSILSDFPVCVDCRRKTERELDEARRQLDLEMKNCAAHLRVLDEARRERDEARAELQRELGERAVGRDKMGNWTAIDLLTERDALAKENAEHKRLWEDRIELCRKLNEQIVGLKAELGAVTWNRDALLKMKAVEFCRAEELVSKLNRLTGEYQEVCRRYNALVVRDEKRKLRGAHRMLGKVMTENRENVEKLAALSSALARSQKALDKIKIEAGYLRTASAGKTPMPYLTVELIGRDIINLADAALTPTPKPSSEDK